MKRSTIIVGVVLAGLLAATIPSSGCSTFNDGGSIATTLDQMSETEFAKWKLYIHLGVKIGANRLLEEGIVSEEDLLTAAGAIELAIDQPFVAVIDGSFLMPFLAESGLSNDEIELLVLIAEQELLSIIPDLSVGPTGVLALSDRTKEVLVSITDALQEASYVTLKESEAAEEMQANFSDTSLR